MTRLSALHYINTLPSAPITSLEWYWPRLPSDDIYGKQIQFFAIPGLSSESNLSINFLESNFREKLLKEFKLKYPSYELNNLKYGVLALGDRAHDNFCNAGKKVDNQLDKLGAQRVIERQECDGNTDGSIEWSEKFLDLISK